MGYRNKEECLAIADKLGIDIAGMTWPQLQKAVAAALAKQEIDETMAKVEMVVDAKKEPANNSINEKAKKLYAELKGQKLTLAPELSPDASRAIHYDEELGDDLIVEEKYFDIRNLDPVVGQRNMSTGTYVLKGKTGRKVVAESALPKENPGLSFTFGVDLAPVVEWNNTRGYRWRDIKALLEASGYYHEYKNQFKQPYVWYAAGILVVDIGLTEHVFREIEETERMRKERGYR